MLRDFDEPAAAHGDLLQRLPVRAFNPLLWLFLGGAGTGTAFHRDVLDTHAWLAVLAGRKRFVLHPPADFASDADFDEHARTAAAVLDERQSRGAWRYLELHPGDVILIPSRWWHAVVNEGPTLGLTRNFATPDILPRVVAAMRAQSLTRLLPWLTGEPQPPSTIPPTIPPTAPMKSPPCPPISTSAT